MPTSATMAKTARGEPACLAVIAGDVREANWGKLVFTSFFAWHWIFVHFDIQNINYQFPK